MPPVRKGVANIKPVSKVPPPLPPSVEEAYRRKCVELRNRTNEVEEANDASRLRLSRIKRQVEKLRIERAFLLEQLAKRTSTNVEDSEGSPSPPPTDIQPDFASKFDANSTKPQEKPLRIKRGHRKASAAGDAEATQSTAGASFDAPQSPTDDTQTQTQTQTQQSKSQENESNGVSDKASGAKDAFEFFAEEKREEVKKELDGKDDADVEKELSQRWEALSEEDQAPYKAKAKAADEEKPKEKKVKLEEPKKDDEAEKSPKEKPPADDEDVEMGDNDAEDPDTQMDKDGDN